MIENSTPVIFGLDGERINLEEKTFFKDVNPAGFILFARNINNPKQVKNLVDSLKDLVGWNCPILIDQEGGRVQRLTEPNWAKYPSMAGFAKLAKVDLQSAKKQVYDNFSKLSKDLAELGINVDCAPVCDLLFDGADGIIGDRSFGEDPTIVAELAGECAKALLDNRVLPVIKHIPGHGRAKVDSHEKLPIVDSSLEELESSDFAVFSKLNAQHWAMTAHIIYECLDKDAPATQSKVVLDYIRNAIGYQGLIISDDLSMKALEGDFSDRAAMSLEAGCDIVLHCNGKMAEMRSVFKGCRKISKNTIESFYNNFISLL